MKKSIVLIIVLFHWLLSSSQNEVSIVLNAPPPYSPYIDELVNFQGASLICINTRNVVKQIYFRLELTGPNGFSATTKSSFRPSGDQIINLGPNETKVLLSNYVRDQFSARILDISNPDNDAIALGLIPEGLYKLCFQAFDVNTEQPVSLKTCRDFRITYTNTPTLIYPPCFSNAEVRSFHLTFTWTPVAVNQAGVSLAYDLYISEVRDEMTQEDMMQQILDKNLGNPYILIENIPTNSYLYMNNIPSIILQKDKKYAWMVVAKDRNNKVAFTNNGRSNLCSFTYKYNQNPVEIKLNVASDSTAIKLNTK